MIDNIILGLLSKANLTTYDIKIEMDKSISKFYSNSFGSINPAIKKLETNKMISCSEIVENSRLKKIYQITTIGKDAYKDWLQEPIQQSRIKDEVLIRIHFLGDSNKAEQKKILLDYLEVLKESEIELVNNVKEIETNNIMGENIKYKKSILEFGIDYFLLKQEWIQTLLNDL